MSQSIALRAFTFGLIASLGLECFHGINAQTPQAETSALKIPSLKCFSPITNLFLIGKGYYSEFRYGSPAGQSFRSIRDLKVVTSLQAGWNGLFKDVWDSIVLMNWSHRTQRKLRKHYSVLSMVAAPEDLPGIWYSSQLPYYNHQNLPLSWLPDDHPIAKLKYLETRWAAEAIERAIERFLKNPDDISRSVFTSNNIEIVGWIPTVVGAGSLRRLAKVLVENRPFLHWLLENQPNLLPKIQEAIQKFNQHNGRIKGSYEDIDQIDERD